MRFLHFIRRQAWYASSSETPLHVLNWLNLTLHQFSLDFVQELYLKELKGYKAPPQVRTRTFRSKPTAEILTATTLFSVNRQRTHTSVLSRLTACHPPPKHPHFPPTLLLSCPRMMRQNPPLLRNLRLLKPLLKLLVLVPRLSWRLSRQTFPRLMPTTRRTMYKPSRVQK